MTRKWKIGMQVLAICGMCLMGLAMTACNTTEGVGEDVEQVGEGIQDVAE